MVLDQIAERILGRAIWLSSRLERVEQAHLATVSWSDLGDAWPFTVDPVELCNGGAGAVYAIANGNHYPVNGLADGFLSGAGVQVSDLREIWRDDPETPDLKVSVGPLINIALAEDFGEQPERFSRRWWRRRRVRALRWALSPLMLATKLLSRIAQVLTASIHGRFGRMIVMALVAGALLVTWLATGILLQEFWEAFTGLWQRPFWEHGIFFAVAPGAMILTLVVFAMRHRDSERTGSQPVNRFVRRPASGTTERQPRPG